MSPVYLVGAGPGSADLLTLRAARVLQEAEVVLYDRLVSPEVLALVNPQAELIYVGKTKGEQDKQQQILQLLLSHARAGRKVVRLKGGSHGFWAWGGGMAPPGSSRPPGRAGARP